MHVAGQHDSREAEPSYSRHLQQVTMELCTDIGAIRSSCRVARPGRLWHKQLPAAIGRRRSHWDVMKNGLYSIHVTLLDGRVGKGSGVILFRDGQILGGDAYLFYTGSYSVKGDTFKGEVLVQRHTSPKADANPLFGGPAPVGIGVTGTFTDNRATMTGTALVGKASQIFGATLHKLADVS
jgi:hypothetical protein